MTGVRAFRYRLPTDPLPIRGSTLDDREGILLQSIEHPSLWSEAAPLPGFSQETISDVVDFLRTGSGPPPPSLAFALSGLSLADATSGTIHVNGLLAGEPREVVHQAARIAQSGFSAVKLKVGRNSVADDIHMIHLVRNELNADQTLRLDANRAWTLKDAIRFAAAIDVKSIEYIEEPTKSPADFEVFFAEAQIPYALDETLQNVDTKLEAFPNAGAYVVKPTLIGGPNRMTRLLKFQKKLVFSSAIESGIGICQVARLASKFSPGVPAGLDTYRWLKQDVLAERWNMHGGRFTFSYPVEPDLDQLEEIPL